MKELALCTRRKYGSKSWRFWPNSNCQNWIIRGAALSIIITVNRTLFVFGVTEFSLVNWSARQNQQLFLSSDCVYVKKSLSLIVLRKHIWRIDSLNKPNNFIEVRALPIPIQIMWFFMKIFWKNITNTTPCYCCLLEFFDPVEIKNILVC